MHLLVTLNRFCAVINCQSNVDQYYFKNNAKSNTTTLRNNPYLEAYVKISKMYLNLQMSCTPVISTQFYHKKVMMMMMMMMMVMTMNCFCVMVDRWKTIVYALIPAETIVRNFNYRRSSIRREQGLKLHRIWV